MEGEELIIDAESCDHMHDVLNALIVLSYLLLLYVASYTLILRNILLHNIARKMMLIAT
jgi:hypothetical protein